MTRPSDAVLAAARRAPDREKIPRALLIAVLVLVLSSLALTSYARLTGRPLEARPADGAVAAERLIRIYGDRDGSAQVLDADGTLIAELTPERGGFISGVWRALARTRVQMGVDPNAPIRLVRFEGGRLALRDPSTGWRAELVGFGRDNHAAFARLLEP